MNDLMELSAGARQATLLPARWPWMSDERLSQASGDRQG
jgi:hypothetical protein